MLLNAHIMNMGCTLLQSLPMAILMYHKVKMESVILLKFNERK